MIYLQQVLALPFEDFFTLLRQRRNTKIDVPRRTSNSCVTYSAVMSTPWQYGKEYHESAS